MRRNGFFFMFFYGGVINMDRMTIIFYFEQVNDSCERLILLAKRLGHFNFSKSTWKKFYIAIFAIMRRNGFFFDVKN